MMKRAPLETRRHFGRRVEARQQFLADIIITAVEGGTGYWATAFGYRHETPTLTRVVLVPNEDYEEAAERRLRRWFRDRSDVAQAARLRGRDVAGRGARSSASSTAAPTSV
jgi:hypothetical protein